MKRILFLSLFLWGWGLAWLPGAGHGSALTPSEAPAAAVNADNYVPPDYIRSRPTLPATWGGRRPRDLTRSEAIELALRYNLDVAIEREQVHMISLSRSRALGAYEPTLRIWGNHNTSQSPPQTAQEGLAGQVIPSTTDSWNLSLSELLPTGTLLNLSFINSRIASGQANAVLPVRYFPSLGFSLTQPLLQGFSLDGRVQWAQVLSARFATEQKRESARKLAMAVLQSTENAYWDLVEKWKTNEVNRDAYELAAKQYELTRKQIAAGIVAPSELLSIQGRLAQVQVLVVSSEADIEEAADTLRKLLNLPPEEWDRPLLPTDPPSFTRGSVPFDDAFERAVSARPELKNARVDLQQASLDLTVSHNRRLPQLNLSASLTTVGQDADYGQALGQLASRAGWQAGVGAELNWAPLGVAARADVHVRESQVRQRRLGIEQVLLLIRGELRAALRNRGNAERQVYAAALSRELSERNLELDQRRFLNGMPGVTNFTLAQRQSELSDARLKELRALLFHERANTQLLQAMGELLEARKLKFEVRAER